MCGIAFASRTFPIALPIVSRHRVRIVNWRKMIYCLKNRRISRMFARTVAVVCLLGLIAVSDNCRAQSDNDRSKQRLPSSYLYSVLNGQKGDKTTFRDSSGRTQGSATQSGSRISIRDGSGRSIGSAETSGNRTTFRDASGRTIQTATTNGERTTFRSSSGSSLGTASQTRNNTTFRDASGRSIGSASSSGTRTTFRDGSGRSSGSASNNRR